MFSWFSKLIDYGVDSQFRRDPSGRLVFVSGIKGKYYFLNSKADEEKIGAFVRMYRSASALLSFMWTGIYAFGWTFYASPGASPARTRVTHLVVSGLAYMLIPILFILILWDVYKRAIPSLTSSLREAGPDVISQLAEVSPDPRRLALLCIGGCTLLLGVILFLVSTQHPSSKSGTCPPQGQASRQPEDSTRRPCSQS